MGCRPRTEVIRQLPFAGTSVAVLSACLLLWILQADAVGAEATAGEYAGFPDLHGPYLGQTPPAAGAEVFAPGIVKPRNGFHSAVVFNEAGNEAWWTEGAVGRTYHTRLVDGTWTRPEPLPFDPEFGVREAMYGPDGRLYFLSRRPPAGDPVERERIWSVARTPDGWSPAQVIAPVVAAHPTHWQFSFTSRGDLYFTSEAPGVRGRQDIYVARRRDGVFAEPVSVGEGISGDTREYCPFVAPDESYLIFSRNLSGGNRRADLFISFRDEQGAWSDAMNMGTAVNSPHNEVCPVVTADGRYLFFTRASQECNDVWWIGTDVIERLRP